MKVGIIGRAGSGRSTVFDALTGLTGAARSTTKTRLGSAPVHDARLDRLTVMYNPKRRIPAEVALSLPPNPTSGLLDIPTVSMMRDLWAYAHVVGAFTGDPEQVAATQMEELTTEMVLADMDRVERRRERVARGGGDRPGELPALERAAVQLDKEQPLRLLDWEEEHAAILDDLCMMSRRPLLMVINVSEDEASAEPSEALRAKAEETGIHLFWLCAPLEAEIAGLDAESRPEFLEAYGLDRPASHRFVQTSLSLLNQICFFTVGDDECRAWPIPRGSRAPRAAHAIHTDLERGFIRAEVVTYEVLMEHGSEAACKAAGKLRSEGKEYEVLDGDVINIRYNV